MSARWKKARHCSETSGHCSSSSIANSSSRTGEADAVESAMANAELAFRMQSAVPDLMDLAAETAATKKLYGLDADFAADAHLRQAVPARPPAGRARRAVHRANLSQGSRRRSLGRAQRTDEQSRDNARTVDQPIAGLLRDLKSRGLLDTTLVVWAGEFGRTPFAQGSDGRDHNPFAFSMWLAGGGVKGGTIYGQTDEYGYKVVENRLTIHDLHATMLHLLGIDHKRLTFRFSGRDIRLTDVHGEVVREILG